MTLKYRANASVEDLALGECTVHSAGDGSGARWWQLWFYVPRDSDGVPEVFVVPVAPHGSFSENGLGGRRTWGFTPVPGTQDWQISPSINVLDDRDVVAGTHAFPSLWHQTPRVEGVPETERWTAGSAP